MQAHSAVQSCNNRQSLTRHRKNCHSLGVAAAALSEKASQPHKRWTAQLTPALLAHTARHCQMQCTRIGDVQWFTNPAHTDVHRQPHFPVQKLQRDTSKQYRSCTHSSPGDCRCSYTGAPSTVAQGGSLDAARRMWSTSTEGYRCSVLTITAKSPAGTRSSSSNNSSGNVPSWFRGAQKSAALRTAGTCCVCCLCCQRHPQGVAATSQRQQQIFQQPRTFQQLLPHVGEHRHTDTQQAVRAAARI